MEVFSVPPGRDMRAKLRHTSGAEACPPICLVPRFVNSITNLLTQD